MYLQLIMKIDQIFNLNDTTHHCNKIESVDRLFNVLSLSQKAILATEMDKLFQFRRFCKLKEKGSFSKSLIIYYLYYEKEHFILDKIS